MSRPNRKESVNRGGLARLNFPAAPFPHGIQLIFKKYDYSALTTKGPGSRSEFSNANAVMAQEKDLVAIELPMPSTLTDSTGITVNSMEQSFVETFIADTISPILSGEGGGAGAIGQNLFEMGEGAVKGVAQLLGDKAGAGGPNSETLAQGATVLRFLMNNTLNSFSPGLGKALGSRDGVAINPQATLAFEGVDLRSFTLDWTLYPESRDEADSIKKIVRSMKSQVLPRVKSVAGDVAGVSALAAEGGGNKVSSALSRAFLEYPSTVSINLLGVDETHFVQFKPCMCSSINVDYGASGEVIVAEGGVPQGIKLSMQFKELEIQTANDYQDNAQGGDNEEPATSSTGAT